MLTPRVTETTMRDPEPDRLPEPRRRPYHRASQRELVRASVMADLHTGAYARHNSDQRES